MAQQYNYLFGPVPSRRLGRSLGIDITPAKTCSFDCLFCQCGTTQELASERREVVPFDDVCAEMERWLIEDGQADCITFAGSGEPTLYSRLGELIQFIKSKTDIPVILLSNGTLMHRADVRQEAALADTVKLSLSAWDEASFTRANRPAPGITLEQTLEGECAFRKEFTGALWLEVFLMQNINAKMEQVQQIANIVKRIAPDKIHLNTAVRPPADSDAIPVPKEMLETFRTLFTPTADVIASFASAPSSTAKKLSPTQLLDLIRRHPATATQLAAMANTNAKSIRETLAPLVALKQLNIEQRDGEEYYT